MTNTLIGSPEKIAYEKGWIDYQTLEKLATKMSKNTYGEFLMNIEKKEN